MGKLFVKKAIVYILFSALSAFFVFGRTIRLPKLSGRHYEIYETKGLNASSYGELLNLLAEKCGWEFEWVDIPEGTYYRELVRGRVDLAYDITKTDARIGEGAFFSNYPCGTEYQVLAARMGDSRYNMGNLKTLDGAVVGYYATDPFQKQKLDEIEKEFNIHLKKYAIFPGQDSHNLLIKETIDLRVTLGSFPLSDEKVVYNFVHYPVYFATFDPSIKADLDRAYQTLTDEDPLFRLSILMKNNNIPTYDFSNFTEEEQAFVVSSEKILVTENNILPVFSNINRNFWDKISDISGLEFEQAEDIVASKEEALRESTIFKMTYSREMEEKGVLFTTPFASIPIRVICSPDVSLNNIEKPYMYDRHFNAFSNDRATIAITANILKFLPYFREKFRPFDYRLCDSVDECLELASQGQVDGALVEDFFLLRINDIEDYPRLKNQTKISYRVPLCIGVYEGDKSALIVSMLNKTFSQLPFEFYSSLLDEWGMYTKAKTARSVKKFWILLGFALAAILVVIQTTIFSLLKAKKYKKKIETDPLTGLLSGEGFKSRANRLLELNPRIPFIMAEVNIRNFSLVNQVNTATYGDQMLKVVANELQKLEGKKSTSLLARTYADSFYVLQKSSPNVSDGVRHVHHLLQTVQASLSVKGMPAVIHGGCAFSASEKRLLEADSMMMQSSYARKSSSNGIYSNLALFDDQVHKQWELEQKIESSVKQAFADREFFVVYQPKVSLTDGKIKGAEALVRWKSKDYGIVRPDIFIPVFEKNGYVSKLDFYVYQCVFEYLDEQKKAGKPLVPISVNVSRLHHDPAHFVNNFVSKFSEYSLDPSLVELEIVERFAGMSNERLVRMTELLRQAGFKVNMDDFGSGESSLNMLSEIPVDVIKFDQRFLRQAEKSKDSMIILTQMVSMVRELCKTSVCEGVETKEQVEILKRIKCDLAQGYFYSKPLMVDDFTAYVASHI